MSMSGVTMWPTLRTGRKLISATVHCPLGEGVIGGPLGDIQKAHPDTIIGSYPKYRDGSFWTELVIRSRSATHTSRGTGKSVACTS